MTRDSSLWWWTMAAGLLLGISSRMDLIDPLLPLGHTDKVHAWIELLAFIIGSASGYAKASRLPISDKGRERYHNQQYRRSRRKP